MRTLAEAALGFGVILAALTACQKTAPASGDGVPPARTAPPEDAAPAPIATAVVAADAERIAPSRCRPADPAVAPGSFGWFGAIADAAAGDPSDLELGDAIDAPAGTVVSLLHRTARGLSAAVASVGAGNGAKPSAVIVDLGPTLGDAPPPRILLAGGEVIAAAYSIAGDGGPAANANARARRLSLYDVHYDVASNGSAKAILDVPQQRDDSLAFDVALVGFAGLAGGPHAAPPAPAARSAAVVVWDEASRAGHGVIRATTVPLGDRTSSPEVPSREGSANAPASVPAGTAAGEGAGHDVSPPESDAEGPRVVGYGAGSIVFWIARRPEPGLPTDAAEVEATGEPRSFGWLESVVLDERGFPAGPVRKLTPSSGHVSAYDVRTLPAAQRPTLLVVARDDGEAVDASGGELLRVRIVGDAVEPPVAFPSDGLGRGGPALVDGDPPWLVWIGPHEQVRLLPLDPEGAPAGKPSAEDEMSEARPLLFLRGAAADPLRRALVASPSDPVAPLRVFTCARGG